jgi:hypothetical protein
MPKKIRLHLTKQCKAMVIVQEPGVSGRMERQCKHRVSIHSQSGYCTLHKNREQFRVDQIVGMRLRDQNKSLYDIIAGKVLLESI